MGKKFAVRVDASGLIAPDIVVDESGSKPRLERGERRISWSEVSGLRITRDPKGYVYYELDVPASPPFGKVLIIPGFDLKDPEGFRKAVEQFTGRRFEKTFEEIPTETETESVADVEGPADAGGRATSAVEQVELDQLEQFEGARSFQVITTGSKVFGSITGIAISFAVIWLLWRFAPPAMGELATSTWGFAIIVVSGWFIGQYWLPRLRRRQRLVVGSTGLYAQVPKRGFPRFTPWEDVRDFTYTIEPRVLRSFHLSDDPEGLPGRVSAVGFYAGARRDEPRHRFTLWTSDGPHFFVCEEIDSVSELLESIEEHSKRRAKGKDK